MNMRDEVPFIFYFKQGWASVVVLKPLDQQFKNYYFSANN